MSDLTDRMRTCAAWIIEHDNRAGGPSKVLANVTLDAADLLIEASNLIEAAHPPLGTPMEVIPPVAHDWTSEKLKDELRNLPTGTWVAPGDTLPTARPRPPRACPACDSRANKTVRRDGNRLMLVCPVCAETWEFKR